MSDELTINRVTISLIQGDITEQTTDVIVNAANPGLMGGGGVDGAIHRAGGPSILEECKKIVARQGSLQTGRAVITTGGNLRARFVIHTVGPVWHGGGQGESELLASAYRESLKLADDRGLKSVSFPSISTGVYGYPVEKAARVALSAVMNAAERLLSVREIVFVLFDSYTYSSFAKVLTELNGQ